MTKRLEEKYQKLSDIEHVLKRSGMYVGSTVPQNSAQYIFDGEKVFLKESVYNPAFLKLFDEILSNSIDEHRRSDKINEIKVTFDLDENIITVWDNGGIPVAKHKDHKEWIPEMIFSNLKAGSNFDDTEERTVAGTHGVGATLTNIFSKKFIVKTCDGKKKFEQTFQDNMNKRSVPKISAAAKGFTEISFQLDLERLKMSSIDDFSHMILLKRCLDAAACNPKLTVKVISIKSGKKEQLNLKFKKFEEYIKLYVADEYFYEESKDWRIGFAHSTTGFNTVSFVNSTHTKDGGTHVDYITDQLISHLRDMIQKKYKVQVKPNDIRNHLYIFVDCTIINPSFSSQTKEKLISDVRSFKTKHEVTEKIAKLIFKSEIIKSVLDWIEKKQLADERAELRKLNKELDKGKVAKLIDATKKGNRYNCILGIYEGESAKSAFRKFRDSQTMGAYPLRGKFINVHELPNSKVIQNEEVKGLMGAIGLKLGEEPKDLRYGKIYIYTDADPDGNSIAAQLINFFAKYWPELFEKNVIYKVMTPLVVATKGTKSLSFYNQAEFDKWAKGSIASWTIEYKKGLASLIDEEYSEIIKNPHIVKLKYGTDSKECLEDWFGKDSSARKRKLLK